MTRYYKSEQGFTLLELMIALVLGLLITAAVIQVYIISTRTAVVQQAGSSILDANVFGLQQIEKNIRLAGLGLSSQSTANGAGAAVIVSTTNMAGISGFNADDVTRDTAGLPTNVNTTGSHQLTIQYRAPMDMRDCEGRLVLGPRQAILETGDDPKAVDGQVVVERYFLTGTSPNLELRCDAGRYITESIVQDLSTTDPTAHVLVAQQNQLLNFGDDGALVVAAVDDFQVRLAVADSSGVQYVTPSEYLTSHNTKSVVAVKTSILTRGNVPASNAGLPANPSYQIFGQATSLKSGVSSNYIRRVYESNSMLRNSRDK